MGGETGQDAPCAAAEKTENQSHQERIGHLNGCAVGHAEQHGLQNHRRPHGHGPLQPGLDDPAEHQFLRQRACHGDGQRWDQAGGQKKLHVVVIVGQPRRRQQHQRQLHHHEEPYGGKGAEGRRPAGAAAQACRLPQRLVPQPEPQQQYRHNEHIGEQRHRRRPGKKALRRQLRCLRDVHLPVGERCPDSDCGGIDDTRQKLRHDEKQQVQQGLPQCSQNVFYRIRARVFHIPSFLSADVPKPLLLHNIEAIPPCVQQPQVASDICGVKRRNLRLSSQNKQSTAKPWTVCVIALCRRPCS